MHTLNVPLGMPQRGPPPGPPPGRAPPPRGPPPGMPPGTTLKSWALLLQLCIDWQYEGGLAFTYDSNFKCFKLPGKKMLRYCISSYSVHTPPLGFAMRQRPGPPPGHAPGRGPPQQWPGGPPGMPPGMQPPNMHGMYVCATLFSVRMCVSRGWVGRNTTQRREERKGADGISFLLTAAINSGKLGGMPPNFPPGNLPPGFRLPQNGNRLPPPGHQHSDAQREAAAAQGNTLLHLNGRCVVVIGGHVFQSHPISVFV